MGEGEDNYKRGGEEVESERRSEMVEYRVTAADIFYPPPETVKADSTSTRLNVGAFPRNLVRAFYGNSRYVDHARWMVTVPSPHGITEGGGDFKSARVSFNCAFSSAPRRMYPDQRCPVSVIARWLARVPIRYKLHHPPPHARTRQDSPKLCVLPSKCP